MFGCGFFFGGVLFRNRRGSCLLPGFGFCGGFCCLARGWSSAACNPLRDFRNGCGDGRCWCWRNRRGCGPMGGSGRLCGLLLSGLASRLFGGAGLTGRFLLDNLPGRLFGGDGSGGCRRPGRGVGRCECGRVGDKYQLRSRRGRGCGCGRRRPGGSRGVGSCGNRCIRRRRGRFGCVRRFWQRCGRGGRHQQRHGHCGLDNGHLTCFRRSASPQEQGGRNQGDERGGRLCL